MRVKVIAVVCLLVMTSVQARPRSGDGPVTDAVYSSTSEPCHDLSGAAMLLNRPGVHIVWLGEQHGTGEMPEFLTDLVCIAATQKRPVWVALERAETEQSDWDCFMASDGSASAIARLTRAPVWTQVEDGRNSRAILVMAQRLRQLKHERRIAGIRLIDRWGTTPDASSGIHRDQELARAVLDIVRTNPQALVLVYSGNLHAMKRRPAWLPADVQNPAASYLPPAEVLSVDLIGESGEVWNCQASGCGPHPYQGESGHPRGIVMIDGSRDHQNPVASEGFDALGYTGVPTTASPPERKPQG
jgi:hypothetical protein